MNQQNPHGLYNIQQDPLDNPDTHGAVRTYNQILPGWMAPPGSEDYKNQVYEIRGETLFQNIVLNYCKTF